MKNKIPVKEMPQTEKREIRKTLASLGIYSVAYDWANHKKQLGEYICFTNILIKHFYVNIV